MHSGILTIGFESDVYQLNLWNNATQYEILVCFIWLMKIVLLTGIWNQKREVKLFDTPPFRTIIWPMTSSLSLKYKQMTSFLVAASIICHHWFKLPSLIIMTLMIIRMSSDQLLFSLSLSNLLLISVAISVQTQISLFPILPNKKPPRNSIMFDNCVLYSASAKTLQIE